MKIALVQDEPILGDVDGTLALMEQKIYECGSNGQGAEIVAFPELFITGYLPEHWVRIPTAEDERAWLERLQHAAAANDVWIVVGHPSYRVAVSEVSTEPVLTNAASLISPSGVVGTYAKVHLYGDEEKTFVSGRQWPTWDTPWGRIAIQICYDIEFPESARMAGMQNADVLINISANMIPYSEHHRIFAQARAMENAMFVVCLNRTGIENDIHFCGGSCVAHPNTTWLLTSKEEPGVYFVQVPIHERRTLEDCVQYIPKRRSGAYSALAME